MARTALVPHRFSLIAVTLAAGCAAPPTVHGPAATAAAPAERPPAPPAPPPEPLLAPSTASPGSEPSGSPEDTRTGKQIQAVITDNRQVFRDCYEAALKDNPGIQGDLVVSFVIDPDGSVKQAEINWSESEIHIPELDTCTVDTLKALRFAASSRGLESRVNYPFNFNPK
jgi:TonB family protein